ncbi:MAG: peptide chain release factor N(5)-glutamine methyltransferase [Candidatus Cloacimonetes bacterium]|nr:peptide chain release factor N(5)-glutamine methyltransferase [Candidatus Cloacimonadota bacterium]
MTNKTVQQLLSYLIEEFEECKIESPRFNAEAIISHVLQTKRLELYLKLKDSIPKAQRSSILQKAALRKKHTPLQYILKETEFYGNKLKVSDDVLIPRPETELLVERIIHSEKNIHKILEIGTGSGAIAISLAKYFPKTAIIATDIETRTLKIARQNAALNNVNIRFQQSDLFENITGEFDIIVSNPPYISKDDYNLLPDEIKDYEPKNALLAAGDGLFFYEKILQNAKEYLTNSGSLYFEIGYDQRTEIMKIAFKFGFKKIQVYKDLNNFDRIIKIQE